MMPNPIHAQDTHVLLLNSEGAMSWLKVVSRSLDQELNWLLDFRRVCGAMVARLTSIVFRYQKVAVSSTVTLILFVDLTFS